MPDRYAAMARAVAIAAALLTLPLPADAQTPQRIVPISTEDARALRPLAERGAAALVFFPDGGPEARVTFMVPVHAPLETVHRVLVEAADWPRFIPALTGVEVLSRTARRAAYRFSAAGPMINVDATCTVLDVSPHRVDFAIAESAFGPAGARWDLTADSQDTTLVTVTDWSDPSQGHWLLRRAAASNPSATAGMNLAVDLSLALAVARRASSLAGHVLPVRPPASPEAPAELSPPPPGPWIALNPRNYVIAFTLTPEGAVATMTLTGQTWAPPERVRARLDDVARYGDHLPGVHGTAATAIPDRFTLQVDDTWDRGGGEVVRSRTPDGAMVLDGATGDLAHVRWRWDVTADPQHGTLLWLTGGVEAGLSSLFTGIAAAREPLLLPGIAALRKLVWLRYMLNGV